MVGKKHVIRITEWKPTSRFPEAIIVQTLGEEGSFETDSKALLYEAGVSHQSINQSANDIIMREYK